MTPKRSPWFPVSQPPSVPGNYDLKIEGKVYRAYFGGHSDYDWRDEPNGLFFVALPRDQWRGLAEKPEE